MKFGAIASQKNALLKDISNQGLGVAPPGAAGAAWNVPGALAVVGPNLSLAVGARLNDTEQQSAA